MSNHKYLYKPLYRPAAFAGLPKGWEYVEAPPDLAHKRTDLPVSKWIHGIIAYDRKLTRDEALNHQLEFVSQEGEDYVNWKVGDRVVGGSGADYDEGRIVSIDTDGTATVAWDSGVRTPAILADLRRGA